MEAAVADSFLFKVRENVSFTIYTKSNPQQQK